MKNVRNRVLAITIATLVAVAGMAIAPATANADTGTTGEVAAALDTVDARNGNLVIEPVQAKADADSAAQTATIDIPADPTKGIKLKGKDGKALTIRMPGARKGDRGKKARNGAVVYGTKGDSVNAAIPGADGTVQMWTHIRNRKAPEVYRYCVDTGSFHLTPDGGAALLNTSSLLISLIAPPSATEKKTGKAVSTSYVAEGNCLAQHVAHKVKGVSYPVVADPWFGWNWGPTVWFSRGETQYAITAGGTIWLAAIVGALTGGWIGPAIMASLVEAGRHALRSNQCLAVTWVFPWFYRC